MNPGFVEILRAPATERRDLFLGTARRLGTPEENIEKDFWVCWILDALFNGLDKGGARLASPLVPHGLDALSRHAAVPSRRSESFEESVVNHPFDRWNRHAQDTGCLAHRIRILALMIFHDLFRGFLLDWMG